MSPFISGFGSSGTVIIHEHTRVGTGPFCNARDLALWGAIHIIQRVPCTVVVRVTVQALHEQPSTPCSTPDTLCSTPSTLCGTPSTLGGTRSTLCGTPWYPV